MKTKVDLEAEFELVRRSFFPRWDRRRQWRVEEGLDRANPRAEGSSDLDNRLMLIAPRVVAAGGDMLARILIHEICHAVARRTGHGKEWIRRMEKAAAKSKRMGRPHLADLLKLDVGLAKEPVQAPQVYGAIQDCVLKLPETSYEDALRIVAEESAMTPDELEREYGAAMLVYENARRARAHVTQRVDSGPATDWPG